MYARQAMVAHAHAYNLQAIDLVNIKKKKKKKKKKKT